MRKVFFSTMPFVEMKEREKFSSEDFDFIDNNKNYWFPISFFVDEFVDDGDDVLFVTFYRPSVFKGEEQPGFSEINYHNYKAEIQKIISGKENVCAQWEGIENKADFSDSHELHMSIKKLIKLLNDGDQVYMDVTRGDKPYAIAAFMGIAACTHVCKDSDLVYAIYAEKYKGNSNLDNEVRIHDLSGLLLMHDMILHFKKGQKNTLDDLLDEIVKE